MYNGKRKSDHDIIAVESKIETNDRFTWRIYTTRPRSHEANEGFKKAIEDFDWPKLLKGKNNNQKVDAFQAILSNQDKQST